MPSKLIKKIFFFNRNSITFVKILKIMKKYLLLILSLFVISSAAVIAQSFTVPQPSYTYVVDGTVNTVSLPVPVTNATNNNIDVVVEKTVNNLAPHHASLFCFGIACYDTLTTMSGVISFGAHTTETLLADLNTNFVFGTSCITYRISDVSNANDFVDVVICYEVTTGINNAAEESTLSSPAPNPADKIAALRYNLNGNYNDYKIAIYNILGNLEKEIDFTANKGVMLLPTSELASGVYFYSLISKNKVINTNKLIVSHKN